MFMENFNQKIWNLESQKFMDYSIHKLVKSDFTCLGACLNLKMDMFACQNQLA